jgi:hypothetical protein
VRRALSVAAALAVLLAGGFLLARLLRAPPTDEERIQGLLADAARAAEEKRAGDVVKEVSERFAGEGLDRRGLRQLVAFQILRGEWVSVTIAGTRLEVAGDGARAAVDVVLARSGRGVRLADLLPAQGSVHRLQLRLEREGGDWKVVRARWRPVAAQAALEGPVLEPDGP